MVMWVLLTDGGTRRTQPAGSLLSHLAPFVSTSRPAAEAETIPWTASPNVCHAAPWPRLCRRPNGPPASPRQSRRCWGPTSAPSTRPAGRPGTTWPGRPSKRPLWSVSRRCTSGGPIERFSSLPRLSPPVSSVSDLTSAVHINATRHNAALFFFFF